MKLLTGIFSKLRAYFITSPKLIIKKTLRLAGNGAEKKN